MKLSKKILFAQEGAPMPAPEGEESMAPEEQGGGEQEAMMQQLQQIAGQIIQQMGPDAAMMLAQMIVEMVQGSQEQQAPVYSKRGGKITRIR